MPLGGRWNVTDEPDSTGTPDPDPSDTVRDGSQPTPDLPERTTAGSAVVRRMSG